MKTPASINWLVPSRRPSRDEVNVLLSAIAKNEAKERAAELRAEIELQLWVTRSLSLRAEVKPARARARAKTPPAPFRKSGHGKNPRKSSGADSVLREASVG